MDNAIDQAFGALYEIFSQPMDPCKGCGRKYILELKAGQLMFRRDEADLIVENAMENVLGPRDGNEIVAEKLAKCFPDRAT